MNAHSVPAALAGVRVLDLTDNHAAYAARLLADLGAEVVRVEPPEGSVVRQLQPAADGISFVHAFLDAGKRSVVIDRTTASGADAFARLLATSDVVFHTPTEAADRLDGVTAASHPGLIVVSITPYGLTGPYAGRAGTDLTVLAAGGLLSLGGYKDTEPLAIAGEQSVLGAAIFAAVAALAALVNRETSGKGRWLDVSGQECIAFALEDAIPEWYIAGNIRRRHGDSAREAGTGVYPCADGYVSMVAGRLGTAKAWTALCEWIAESGSPGSDALRAPEWKNFQYRQSADGIARFAGIFRAFGATRGKQLLYREGQARQIAIAPVNTIADLSADAQLEANGFFTQQAGVVPSKAVVVPGAPYRLSRTPARRRGLAPALGEADGEMLAAPVAAKVAAGA